MLIRAQGPLLGLILIMFVIFGLQLALGRGWYYEFMVAPLEVVQAWNILREGSITAGALAEFGTLLSYAFLHGGWLHLAMNGAAFLGLGHMLVQAIGIGRFLVIFTVCSVVAALTFGLIADTRGPMVGASGAVFGMLAVLTAWQEHTLRLAGLSRAMIWKRIGGLVVVNAALAFGLGGLLAWEAHLGGWVAGWLLAAVFRPRYGQLRAF